MFLQRADPRAARLADNSNSRHGYASQRSYPPTAPSPAESSRSASKPQASTSLSPPQSPGKNSFGVFLQNCQMSGDFLQLRTNGAASHTPVRLYLTDTEIVKKTAVSGSSTTYAPDQDFTISRYSLQDVQVCASKVSPATLVVSIHNPPSNGRLSVAVGVADDPSSVTTNSSTKDASGFPTRSAVRGDNSRTSAAHPHNRSDEFGHCNGITFDGASSDARRPVVVVEAYQLISETQSIAAEGVRHWITSVEKNKRKLEMLDRLRQITLTASITHATANPTSSESTSVPLPPLSPAATSPPIPIVPSKRPANTSSSSSSPRRRPHSRESEVLFRQSGYDYPSFGSPTREKLPTTTNGRYTPLHHHYTPHPLFSNSHHHPNSNSSAVQLRQRRKPAGKEPFRLLRRLSLGAGTSGSYHFPPPHEHGVRDESKNGKGSNGIKRTTYNMYSLSQDDSFPPAIIPPSISQSEILSSNVVGDASPRQQATPIHKGGTVSSWKQRRSIFSRSVSENYNLSDRLTLSPESPPGNGNTTTPVPTQHLGSEPSPTEDTEERTRYHVSGEMKDDGIPFELRALQSLLTNLTSSHSSQSTLPPSTHGDQTSNATTDSHSSPHTPSDDEEGDKDDDHEGFQSFLRHKQIRGRKIHVSPRANNSNSLSSELLSPPLWMDRFSIPSPPNATTTNSTGGSGVAGDGKMKPGSSSSLPRRLKVKTESSPGARTSRTLDREESSSPGPKSASKTPKLFKRFHRHRRWQSSSGVKLELEMIPPSTTHEDLLDPPLPDLKQPQPLATTTTSVVERLYLLPAREVAERLTQMDAHLLSCIPPDEIRDGAWMKRGQKEKLAPNILAMVQSFNQLALLVPTEILGERTSQQRAKVISAYIQIANKCYYLKNFNSLKAILAGLQSTPVYRLRKSWKDIPSKRKKQFKMLCRLMSEENNWQVYRDELDGCLASSAPCVPYLGQFLTQVCHQLSYDKMRAEKEEVQLRRRSQSFVGMVDENRKEGGGRAGEFRRRSNSFHRSSLEVSGVKETSLSTPVSPVVSEDESESSKNSKGEDAESESSHLHHRVVAQMGRRDGQEDSQSLEFSLDLDDQELPLPMSQPEPTSIGSPESPEGGDKPHSKAFPRRKKRRPSITNFHSTPVKDANGYIKPLCSPLKMTFDDELPTSLGYNEPDFSVLPPQYQHEKGAVSFENEQSESSRVYEENTDSEYRIKIPSISLQKTSSHSSLDEDWDEHRVKALPEGRKISKSRSLESNLGLGLNGTGRERNEASDGESRLNRLTPSHSIPSLDSDSVFSIEDEQREGEREGEGKEREREKEGAKRDREEEGEGEGKEDGEREVEEKKTKNNNRAKGFVRRKLQYQFQASFERSLDSEISVEDAVETYRPTTSTTSNATPSTTTQDISQERGTIFSPISSSSEFTHSRDQSFSTVESYSVAYGTRDTSSSPVETPNTEQDSIKHEVVARSTKQGERVDRKKARKHSVHRSKSVTGAGTYIHKWRWKKAIALTSSNNNSTTPSTLNNADPFHLLQIYKDRSGECLRDNATTAAATSSSSANSRTDFRVILNRFNSNSETRNYELSFEREP